MTNVLTDAEFGAVQHAINVHLEQLSKAGITLKIKRDFKQYANTRRDNGAAHLNQAFDPAYVRFRDEDFWLLAENSSEEPIATYCSRHCPVDDFFDFVRNQTLWFDTVLPADERYVVDCEISPFGGAVSHGGGLWVREDYRGFSNLASILPRFARAVALRNRPFDWDSGMIISSVTEPDRTVQRRAVFTGVRTYGFARVKKFVGGWFPPERRDVVLHLCHSSRAEAVRSLVKHPEDGTAVFQAAAQASKNRLMLAAASLGICDGMA